MIYIIVNTPLPGPYVLATKKWEWENTCITIHNNITLQKFRTKDFTQFECGENSAVSKKLTQLKVFCCLYQKISPVILEQLWTSQHLPQTSILNWRAQSKNNPLIFRPFLKVSTCQNSTTSEHFQKWLKNQGIILALSPPIINQIHVCLKGLSTYICVELYKVTVN